MEKPVRILIADDHDLVREGIRSIIQSHPGWSVCGEAKTGRDALSKALALKPDVLILDHALPEMNGVEVARRARGLLDAPILFVTMHDADEIVRQAFDAGVNGYLLKTDVGRTLTEAVETVLSKGRFVSERLRAGAWLTTPGAASAAPTRLTMLTPREREVLQLLAEGRTNKELAQTLGISVKTAETHRARVMAKLEIHSMADLVHYAVRNGIVEP